MQLLNEQKLLEQLKEEASQMYKSRQTELHIIEETHTMESKENTNKNLTGSMNKSSSNKPPKTPDRKKILNFKKSLKERNSKKNSQGK
jgi:hypothetical protein